MHHVKFLAGMSITDTGCPGCSERGWHVFGISAWWILLLVIFGVAILLILRYLTHPEDQVYVDEYDDAVTILKKRYAKGEITKEEYDDKIKDIIHTSED